MYLLNCCVVIELTKRKIVADKVKDDLCGQSVIGRKLLDTFRNEWIK